MKLTWKSFEDFSAIEVDKGMVEDHLPTAVMAGLKQINRQFIGAGRYDPNETERIRMEAKEQYQQKMTAIRRGESVDRASVDVESHEDTSWSERVKAFEAIENRRSKLENESGASNSNADTQSHSIEASVTLEDASVTNGHACTSTNSDGVFMDVEALSHNRSHSATSTSPHDVAIELEAL